MTERLSRFGNFVLDPDRHVLYRGEEVVDLPESALVVLEVLVENAPDTVDKQLLIDAAWPDTVVVSDNLVQAIHTIRTALGGDARNPQFVRTVHRKGYRFVAPVSRIPSEDPAPSPSRSSSPSGFSSRLPRFIGIAALVILLGIIAFVALRSSPKHGKRSERSIQTIAVLPLENLSGDPEQEYFADGMTDSLITELARIENLGVISRTSVMQFKNTRATVPEIAAVLEVDAVVEGSVTRADGRIRVIAQLVDADDHHIWGENYDRRLGDVLKLQRELAESIAREIGARIEGRSIRPPAVTVDPRAHEAVLRGRHFLRKRTKPAFDRAIGFFNQAITLDPRYAAAYAGLADSYNLLANYGFSPSPEVRPRAREAALKALEIDPDLAEAHLALALVAGEYDWDFDEAERQFAVALALRPSSPLIRSRHAQLLIARGKLGGAISEIEKARDLDPLSDIINANVGWFLFLDGQNDVALEKLRNVIAFSPDFAVTHYYLGVLLDREKRFDEAISELQTARRLSDGADYVLGALAHAQARSGHRGEAEGILRELLEKKMEAYVSPIALAVASFGLDRPDEAFAHLEQAFIERKGWLLHLRVEPALDGFRSDPRYLDLVDRIGLPEVSKTPAKESDDLSFRNFSELFTASSGHSPPPTPS